MGQAAVLARAMGVRYQWLVFGEILVFCCAACKMLLAATLGESSVAGVKR